MYQFYNAHPDGKRVGDCVKRAICTAEQRDYNEVALELNRLKKQTGAKRFNSNENWKQYVANKKYRKLSFPAERGKSRMDGKTFCEMYSKGRYILRMAGHLSCCIDGVIYDLWDCSAKCVYNAWEVI